MMPNLLIESFDPVIFSGIRANSVDRENIAGVTVVNA